MAEHPVDGAYSESVGDPVSGGDVDREMTGPGRRGPAPVLLIAGLGALLVGVGVGFGALAATVDALAASPLDWRWVVVVVTVVVGSLLVGTGLRRGTEVRR